MPTKKSEITYINPPSYTAEVLNTLNECIKKSPADLESRMKRADWYARNKNLSAALDDYNFVINFPDYNPINPLEPLEFLFIIAKSKTTLTQYQSSARANRAYIYAQQGEYTQSMKGYALALELNPNNKFAEINLIKLQEKLKSAKNNLQPILKRLDELISRLNNKAFEQGNTNSKVINKKYELIARKMITVHTEIMKQVNLSGDKIIDSKELLRILKKSQALIKAAQKESEFSTHRGLMRNCPILRELCACLDLIVNLLNFLNKKINKTLSGDNTPVFANKQEMRHALFKPALTTSARKIEELNNEIEWSIRLVHL